MCVLALDALASPINIRHMGGLANYRGVGSQAMSSIPGACFSSCWSGGAGFYCNNWNNNSPPPTPSPTSPTAYPTAYAPTPVVRPPTTPLRTPLPSPPPTSGMEWYWTAEDAQKRREALCAVRVARFAPKEGAGSGAGEDSVMPDAPSPDVGVGASGGSSSDSSPDTQGAFEHSIPVWTEFGFHKMGGGSSIVNDTCNQAKLLANRC
jgi:hypothetical protein